MLVKKRKSDILIDFKITRDVAFMTFLNFSEYYLHGKIAAKHCARTVLLMFFCIFAALILSPDTSLFSITGTRSVAAETLCPAVSAAGETALEEETVPDNKVLFDVDRTTSGGMFFLQIGNGRLSKNFSTRIHSVLHWLVLVFLLPDFFFFWRKTCFCRLTLNPLWLLLKRTSPVRAGPCA